MTANEIVAQLKKLGNEGYKKTFLRHGAKEPIFGVKIEDMKKIQKKVKVDYELALALYDTGIYDAMYLAGLIADDAKMTKADLKKWLRGANWSMLCNFTVPWVAAGSRFGRELALEWIESKNAGIASSGWATLSSLVSITPDDKLDIDELKTLLDRVQKTIHKSPDAVRYSMNTFVIAVGSYVAPLTEHAIKVGKAIGKVTVDMGDTDCKVPSSPEYIEKVKQRGTIGKKRKSAKC